MPTEKKPKQEKETKDNKELEALEKKLHQAERDKSKLERECALLKDKETELLFELGEQKKELAILGKSVTLNKETKKSLQELSDFLFSLYRESQHPGVRKNIQNWRSLVSRMTQG